MTLDRVCNTLDQQQTRLGRQPSQAPPQVPPHYNHQAHQSHHQHQHTTQHQPHIHKSDIIQSQSAHQHLSLRQQRQATTNDQLIFQHNSRNEDHQQHQQPASIHQHPLNIPIATTISLHRPNHPPPPPPPHHQLHHHHNSHDHHHSAQITDPNIITILHSDKLIRTVDNETARSDINVSRNSLPTRANNLINELPPRISLQHNNYANAQPKYFLPPDINSHIIATDQLDGYHISSRSFLDENGFVPSDKQYQDCLTIPPSSNDINLRTVHPPSTSATVADSGNTQDHYTEEVIQAILAAKEALEKPIEERDERDIMLIDNLCSLVHGFDAFPRCIRRALAAQTVLIVIDEKGKELIVHNEELDSFCVLIFGECEQLNVTKTKPIRQYNVGDAFGVLELTTEIIRFVGYMVTKCENCAFLCVKRDDFYSILTDPASYPTKHVLRHRDRNENVICISQYDSDKKSSGPLWSYQTQVRPFKLFLPSGHVIVKATEPCLMMALVYGYDRLDPDYIDDFLLLFRVFMSYDHKDKEKRLPPGMINLCLTLAKWLDNVDYRDKVIKIILTWLSSYYHDFELNSEFSYLFFKVLESRLLNLCMNTQLHLLHVTLSTQSKVRHVTISRSSREQPLGFSIAGGYEKNCGIFVTQVQGSSFDENPLDAMMNYLNITGNIIDGSRQSSMPMMPHRMRLLNSNNHSPYNNEQSRTQASQLKPGDQILEVNGTNFSAIKLIEAQKRLDMSTHLSLTVKYNPSAFYEMRALPEGRRKSSMSSISSVSPYPSANGQVFTFNHKDPQHGLSRINSDSYPPSSPLFSASGNFTFKSIVKTAPKNDRSRLSNFLINSSKQMLKQIRDSTTINQASVETASKTSDNVSDDQSNDLDFGKTRSSSDILNLKGKDKQIESGLSNVVRLDDMNPAVIVENQSSQGTTNQTLVNVLRVFNAANNDSRYLLVHEETTAREVVMVAVREFNLTSNATQSSPGEKTISSLNWHLYEVSVVPESRTIKQKCLSEQTSRLAERASICSRFYIKNNSQSTFGPSRLDMGDDSLVNEILKESPAHVTLTSLNATLLAVELTLADFDKFRGIEPQQFVYDTFFDCTDKNQQKMQQFNPSGSLSSQETASLKSSSSDGQESSSDSLHSLNKTRVVPSGWMQEYRQFADISNREMFWVICEILNERNIGRRVKIVKQFVRVADVCSQLRNYNSMFAIISGLGHSCVTRLRRTFDKLKPKYKNQLEKMRSLFDPSKNMSNYRVCLSRTQPPAIPLFPQIKKDLTFTKEGRSIFVRETNDISDDELDINEHGGMADFSQDTIKRKTHASLGADLLNVKSATTIIDNDYCGASSVKQHQHQIPNAQSRSISYTSFYQHNTRKVSSTDSDSVLINFTEIRHFTERVRNVIYFSSVPYSNDLLTNTKESQRTQAQIKKMHEEWQMRKRIRHYISQTLANAPQKEDKDHTIRDSTNATSKDNLDQVDSTGRRSGQQQPQRGATLRQQNGKIAICYDERTLYQRSLEVESDMNPKPQVTSGHSQSRPTSHRQHMVTEQQLFQQQAFQQQQQQQQQHASQLLSASSSASSLQPQAPPSMMINLQVPSSAAAATQLPTAANSSPTLSKSSSLSSCSSFNHNNLHHHMPHHLPNFHGPRGSSNLTSSLGKFGTESTESLRKLKALSESANREWRSSCNNNTGNHTNSNCVNNNGNGLHRISGSGSSSSERGIGASLAKNLVPSRILQPKSGR